MSDNAPTKDTATDTTTATLADLEQRMARIERILRSHVEEAKRQEQREAGR